jgi:hypothetical protein
MAVKYEFFRIIFIFISSSSQNFSCCGSSSHAKKCKQNSRQLDSHKTIADPAVTSAQFQKAFKKYGASSERSSALISLFLNLLRVFKLLSPMLVCIYKISHIE